ncbi:MAG: High-affinity heme uptake system protein IsdE precursor [Syntrophorhabdus sp. PtaU1.Bin058]|nr:MAG: High-affinity heme uptake system protein IsdE precursor [Syntrophorhabdus sp. PtaU1.Bin058]
MFNERKTGIAVAIIVMFLALAVIPAYTAMARDITDMAGRTVALPDPIRKVYAPSPYGSYIMYSIDPSMLSGLNLPIKEEDRKYFPKEVQGLPVIGSLAGQGQAANIEVLLKTRPDLLIMWSANRSAINERTEASMKRLNTPFVYAVAESLNDYPEVYLFLGKVLRREERTKQLSSYCRKTLEEVKGIVSRIPKEKRPAVYYAEGMDGLSTECNDSIHVELLGIAGDRNVHRCHTSSHKGFEKVSIEQVMLYNPDVIVAQEKVFYDKVYSDPVWKNVKAVKERRVYLIPRAPFNWFDRPPSFMRILGLKWLMNCLYPNEYRIDIVKEAQAFYSLFLGVVVSDEEMRRVIYR